jgi:hypothetical protein
MLLAAGCLVAPVVAQVFGPPAGSPPPQATQGNPPQYAPQPVPGTADRIPAAQPNGPLVPIRRVENQEPAATGAAAAPAAAPGMHPALAPQPGDHPLSPAIRWAKIGLAEMDKVKDYSCTMVKRELIDGTLTEHIYMFAKVRNQPFSVYIYFLAPESMKGQEALYVAGQNDGKVLGHANGLRHKAFGTLALKPDGMLAMQGNRYPITQMGIKRLLERLIEVGEHDMKFGECEVKILPGAKVSGRICTCIQVVHPTPRKEFIFNMARVYVDDQLNLPIRYEAYEFPKEAGGKPVLAEEYTYLNLKLNNGFTDQDFDQKNPNYQFQ